MNKYKAGDKIVFEITDYPSDLYYVISTKNNKKIAFIADHFDRCSKPLSEYTEKLEKKNQNKQKRIEKLVERLHRQAAEITRLLTENAELKELQDKRCDTCIENERAAGREEAWKLAGKIFDISDGGYSIKELEKVFGTDSIYECFINLTYAEAAAKVEAYEKKNKKLNVGDVVECMEKGEEYVVTCIADDFRSWNVAINKRGDYIAFKSETSGVKKTGRTLPVSDWLKQIGGEE